MNTENSIVTHNVEVQIESRTVRLAKLAEESIEYMLKYSMRPKEGTQMRNFLRDIFGRNRNKDLEVIIGQVKYNKLKTLWEETKGERANSSKYLLLRSFIISEKYINLYKKRPPGSNIKSFIQKHNIEDDKEKWIAVDEYKNKKRVGMYDRLRYLLTSGKAESSRKFLNEKIGEERYNRFKDLWIKTAIGNNTELTNSAIEIMKCGKRPPIGSAESILLQNHFNNYTNTNLETQVGRDMYVELVTLWFSTSKGKMTDEEKRLKIKQWLLTSHLDYYDCLDAYKTLKETNDLNSVPRHILTLLEEEFDQNHENDNRLKLLSLFKENDNLKGYTKLKNLWNRIPKVKYFKKPNSKISSQS